MGRQWPYLVMLPRKNTISVKKILSTTVFYTSVEGVTVGISWHHLCSKIEWWPYPTVWKVSWQISQMDRNPTSILRFATQCADINKKANYGKHVACQYYCYKNFDPRWTPL